MVPLSESDDSKVVTLKCQGKARTTC